MLRAKAAGGRPCWGRESLLFIPFSQFPHALQHWHMVVRRQTPQGAILQHITSGCFSSSQKTYKETHTDQTLSRIYIKTRKFSLLPPTKNTAAQQIACIAFYYTVLYRLLMSPLAPHVTKTSEDPTHSAAGASFALHGLNLKSLGTALMVPFEQPQLLVNNKLP